MSQSGEKSCGCRSSILLEDEAGFLRVLTRQYGQSSETRGWVDRIGSERERASDENGDEQKLTP